MHDIVMLRQLMIRNLDFPPATENLMQDLQELKPESSGEPYFQLVFSCVLAALAGGMGWGIRGQYGHETGAMIFGILVGFVIVLFHLPVAGSLQAARVIALFTIAIGFGGSMTYGQTVGLTMDTGVHGNIADPHFNPVAFRWGMLGLAIKGGLWIGFGGLFLGLGLGGKNYRPAEMFALGLLLLGLFFAGCWLINTPFDPDAKKLPFLYFSDHWQWEAADNVKPRREVWGGMLCSLAFMAFYVRLWKKDRLAWHLCLWGMIAGLGFPLGQSFQAAANWDSTSFQNSWWHVGINTWNLMEVTFGMFAGGSLALGVWLNRQRIVQHSPPVAVSLSPAVDGWLIGSYIYLLMLGWYFENSAFVMIQQYGVLMGLLPMTTVIGGRLSPFLYVFPVVGVSIIVKTYLARFRNADFSSTSAGLLFLVSIPLAILIWLAFALAAKSSSGMRARQFAAIGLPVTAALYFWLNFTFLSFPWGWFTDWRGMLAQHHSGGVYVVAWLFLSLAGLFALIGQRLCK